MALTLDGTTQMPYFGGNNNSAGLGVGGGVLGGLLAGGIGGALAGGLMNRGGGYGGGYGPGYVGGPAATAVATDIVLNPAFQSLQHQLDNVNSTVLHAATDRSFDQTQSLIASTGASIMSRQGDIATALAAGNFTTLNSINGLGRDISAQSNQNALQQLNSFNNLTTTTLQGFNSSAMQMQNSTNQIIAQGTANAAAVAHGFCDISKQMAECCCEMKGLVSAEASATRALISDLNVQNLRDQLAAANGKVSNNEQNQYLLNTILAHIKPTSTII